MEVNFQTLDVVTVFWKGEFENIKTKTNLFQIFSMKKKEIKYQRLFLNK
jgi:hypothetical protein